MKKVFVSGGTGFVGSYMIRQLLKKGYHVRALKRKNSPTLLVDDIKDKIEWVEGDLNDFPSLSDYIQGVDQIYHAAALVSFNAKDRYKMLKVNVEGTENLVNLALEYGIEKFLHVSSIAALGRTEKSNKVNENSLWENSHLNSDYAISKFKAESEVWRGIQEGLSAVIVNPSLIMGSGFWHQGTNKMFQQIDKGLLFYTKGAGGFVDVRDVAKASIALMESDISGERFILNSQNIPYQDLFTMIAKNIKKPAPKILASSWMLNLMWRFDSIKSSVLGVDSKFSKELIRSFETKFDYENNKIVKDLGYEFIPTEQTISQTAIQYLESKKNNSIFAILKD